MNGFLEATDAVSEFQLRVLKRNKITIRKTRKVRRGYEKNQPETSNIKPQTTEACQFFTPPVHGTIIEYQGLNP